MSVQTTYSVSIFENSRAGTFVVDVNATDQDTGDYGEVRYQLEDNPNNAFTIDPVTVTSHYSLLLSVSWYVMIMITLSCDDDNSR